MSLPASKIVLSRMRLSGSYCLFVGAGVSVCSMIPLATTDLPGLPSVVTHIKRDFYESVDEPPITDDQLDSWYVVQKLLQNPNSLYSDALNLIGDTPRSRQHYLKRFFEGATPGTCHESIASLVASKQLSVVFTTNFDPLIEDAIRQSSDCPTPKVAAHPDSVGDIMVTEDAPCVLKLHGDYLFSDIRNTTEETEALHTNMREKMRSFLRERGLIVVGYGGRDESIAAVLEQMVHDGGFFPFGCYWLYLDGSPPPQRIRDVVANVGGGLLPINGAETFLSEILETATAIQ